MVDRLISNNSSNPAASQRIKQIQDELNRINGEKRDELVRLITDDVMVAARALGFEARTPKALLARVKRESNLRASAENDRLFDGAVFGKKPPRDATGARYVAVRCIFYLLEEPQDPEGPWASTSYTEEQTVVCPAALNWTVEVLSALHAQLPVALAA